MSKAGRNTDGAGVRAKRGYRVVRIHEYQVFVVDAKQG